MDRERLKSEDRAGFRFKTGGFELTLQIVAGLAILLLVHFCTSG